MDDRFANPQSENVDNGNRARTHAGQVIVQMRECDKLVENQLLAEQSTCRFASAQGTLSRNIR